MSDNNRPNPEHANNQRAWAPTVLAILAGFAILAAALVGAAMAFGDRGYGEPAAVDPTEATWTEEIASPEAEDLGGAGEVGQGSGGEQGPNPTEPTEPVDPVEPVEPVDPVEPTEPVEPVDPIISPVTAPTAGPGIEVSPPAPPPGPGLGVPEDGTHVRTFDTTALVHFEYGGGPYGTSHDELWMEKCSPESCSKLPPESFEHLNAPGFGWNIRLDAGYEYRWWVEVHYHVFVPHCESTSSIGRCVVSSEIRTLTISQALVGT